MTERVKAQLISDLVGEVRENITRTTKYTFLPEQSTYWYTMKASFMQDTAYPYNNYITTESIKEELFEALCKEYPDCTITYDVSPHLTYTIEESKPVENRMEYRGILKTLFAYLP